MLKTLLISALVAMTLILSACQTNTSTTTDKDPGWVRTTHKKETSASENIWDVIGKEFELKKYWDNPRVQTQVAFYTKNKRFFDKVSANAEPYMYQVFDEVKNADLPTEMIVLPMVESGFDPYVYSSGKAAGIWQFVPGTGRLYGLKQVGNYDGRRDIQASTQAAVKYLRRLNEEMNGDWLLTLASYNSGEGAIKKAMEANRRQGKKTDYFSLNLSKETQLFVPRILAISKMLSDPERYGIKLNFIPYSPYFGQVQLPHNSGFSQLATASGVSSTELKKLNPGYSKTANAVDKQYAFLVPIKEVDRFDADAVPAVNTIDKVSMPEKTKTPQSVGSNTKYTVKSGDNLGSIARRYHVSVNALAEANHINSTTTLHLGQTLLIPNSTTATTTPKTSNKVNYTIKSGDTLSKVAKRFNVNIDDLKKWNPAITSKSKLALGDKLTIYPKSD
jgi:membrane-bound lytic murein transglycosylase D